MKFLFKFFILLIIIFLATFVYYKTNIAADCTATSTGNWNDGANWSGCTGEGGTPGDGDNITINNSIEITVNADNISIGTLTIEGTLLFSGNYTFNTNSIDVKNGGTFNGTGSTSEIVLDGISGVLVTVESGGTFTAGDTAFTVISDASVTFMSGVGVIFNAVEFSPILTTDITYIINQNSTTLGSLNINPSPNMGVSNTLTVEIGANITVGGALTIQGTSPATTTFYTQSGGTEFDLTSGSVTIEPTGTFNPGSSTITLTGNATPFVNNGSPFNASTSNFIFNGGGDGFNPIVPITDINGNISFYNLSFSAALLGGFFDTFYTLGAETINVGNNFTISGSAVFEPGIFHVSLGGAMNVSGDTSISFTGGGNSEFNTGGYAFSVANLTVASSGQFIAGASTVTISGNFTNNGYFQADTSNFIFNSNGTSVITGASDFYDLSITSSGAKEVNFSRNASHIIGVTHTFTVTGVVDNLIKLYSDLSGNKWHFNPTGTASVSYATIRDGGCEETAINITPINSTNGGNNESCWILTSVPTVPLSLSATAGNAQVALSWSAPASNGGSSITDYIVEYAVNVESPEWAVFADGTSTSTSATVTSLTNGTNYIFRIKAVNAIGTGSPSDTTTATPVTVPGIPTSLSGVSSSGQVALDWSAPVSNGGSAITDYIVEYKLSSNDSWAIFADGTSTVTSTVVTSLANGVTYNFRVSAVNSVGTGTTSDVASVVMPSIASANSGSVLLIDKKGPVMSKIDFIVNDGIERTNNRIIPIKIKTGGDVDRMAISRTEDFSEVGIVDFEPEFTLDICEKLEVCELGKYSIYIKFYTIWGYDSPVFSGFVYYDPESKFEFSRNLTLFDVGAEVMKLQEFLNSQGFLLSKFGAGSEGNETMFFGYRTRRALVKFQEKYYKDILEPSGFKRGTGIFGDFTRNFVNSKFFGK